MRNMRFICLQSPRSILNSQLAKSILPSRFSIVTYSQSSKLYSTGPSSSLKYHSKNRQTSFSITTTTNTLPVTRTMSTTTASDVFPPPSLRPILEEVTTLLSTTNTTIAVAETAAGGLLSASILSTPGASKIYKGGLTLYTLPSRIAYAGWSEENLKTYTGPTPDIVAGLAQHVRGDLGADYVVAESGTAGPTGGETRNRRPGYVALAVSCEKGVFTREVETGLGGDRTANMVRFAEEGLRLVRDVIKGEAKAEEKLYVS